MFNLKFRKPSTKFFLSFSILIIAGFSILLFLGAILMPSFPVGESDDYMLSTISLENRFSLFIFPSDIEQAKSDFPEHMWSWQNYVLMKTDYPGILHPHYSKNRNVGVVYYRDSHVTASQATDVCYGECAVLHLL